MTNQEAIIAIKANWPSENYSILREALEKAVDVLGGQRRCVFNSTTGLERCCTHDCDGCMFYVLSDTD